MTNQGFLILLIILIILYALLTYLHLKNEKEMNTIETKLPLALFKESKQEVLTLIQKMIDNSYSISIQPHFLKPSNRIKAGIKTFICDCPTGLMSFDRICPDTCIFQHLKNCSKMYFIPNDEARNSYETANRFLNDLMYLLRNLPEFCFANEYRSELFYFIDTYDKAFKKKQLKNKING